MEEELQKYGLHRVISPKETGVQSSQMVNSIPKLLSSNEILIKVDILNLDSTSMHQIISLSPSKDIKERDIFVSNKIREIVSSRGKQHNPVTNSGGVLVGTVVEVGKTANTNIRPNLHEGMKIIPLCSLTAIPLYIGLNAQLKIEGEQVHIQSPKNSNNDLTYNAYAILFQSTRIAIVPPHLPINLSLSAIDISRLLPQEIKIIHQIKEQKKGKKMSIFVIGCGKAGLAALLCARLEAPNALIIGCDFSDRNITYARNLGVADFVHIFLFNIIINNE